MNPNQQQSPFGTFAIIAGLMVIGVLYFNRTPATPLGPDTPDIPANCPKLKEAFAKTDDLPLARTHAIQFATVCSTFANVVEYDMNTSAPRFTRGEHLDDFRLALRQQRMRGFAFGTKYPDLKDVLQTYLDEKLGKKGGPLDDDAKRKWIAAFRELASCSELAAKHL